MWIRTQNKYILANVNSIRICKCDLDGCVYYSIHGHYDRYEQSLGYYSTKEKALNVLDKIQNSLEHSNNSVFQMPQNEDVELTFEEFQEINNKYNYSMVFCNQFKCLSNDEYEKLVKSLIKEGFR